MQNEAKFVHARTTPIGTVVIPVVNCLISVFVIVTTRPLYPKVVLSLISDDLAESAGIRVAPTSFAYLLLVTLVVAIGIRIVGTLLVGALVIVPAVAAKNVGANLSSYASLSSIIGLVSAVTGVLLSSYAGLPAGPLRDSDILSYFGSEAATFTTLRV